MRRLKSPFAVLIATALGGSLYALLDPTACGTCSGAADLVGGLPLALIGTAFYALLLTGLLWRGPTRLALNAIALAAGIHGGLLLLLFQHSVFCAPCVIAGSAAILAFGASLLRMPASMGRSLTAACAMIAVLFATASPEMAKSDQSAFVAQAHGQASMVIMTRAGCHFCEQLERDVMPGISAEFGDRIRITRIPAAEGVPSPTILLTGQGNEKLVGLPRTNDLRGAIARALGDESAQSEGVGNLLGLIAPWQANDKAPAATAGGGITYHVAKNGSDANSCAQAQNAATPKLTISSAVNCFGWGATDGAGRTIVVHGGTYAETFDSNIGTTLPGGTGWDAPFTLMAAPGETVRLKPTSGPCGGLPCFNLEFYERGYIVIDHIIADGTNIAYDNVRFDSGTHHVRFQNGELYNAYGSCVLGGGEYNEFLNMRVHECGLRDPSYAHNAMYLTGNYFLVENCEVYDNESGGIMFWDQWGKPSHNVARGNWVHDFREPDGSAGIGMYQGTGNIAVNNVVANIHGPGIVVQYGCTDCEVYNNTSIGNFGQWGVGIGIGTTATRANVRNNLAWGNAAGDISIDSSTSTGSNNLCQTGDCAITQDPKFVNASARDYHIQSTSPARDKGVAVPYVTTDKDGVSRPQGAAFDIGAYEIASGATPSPSPTPTPTPTPTSPSLTMSATSVQPSASVSVTIADGPGNRLDWVGLYAMGSTDTQELTWKYLNNSQTAPATGVKSATLTFQMPANAGTYEFRLFPNDIYSPRLATSPAVTVASAPSPAPTPTPTPSQTPYGGTAMAIPGTIATAKYDNGGEGVAFHDIDGSNQMSSTYRPGLGVDSNGAGVGWIYAGEWLEYTVNVSTAGSYTITVPVSQTSGGGTMHVSFNGTNLTGALSIPNTGGWDTYQNITKSVSLSAGTQVVQIVFDTPGSNGYGPGLLDVTVNGSSDGNGTGLSGQYFDNFDFTGTNFTRTDATVNFDWGMGAPTNAMGVDYYSVRWTGRVQAEYSQTYTFHVTGDDGVRLWVNGQLLIDKWLVQSPTEYAASINLTAGTKYDIKLEYYENFGGAVAQLRWSSPSTPKAGIPTSQLFPASNLPTGTG